MNEIEKEYSLLLNSGELTQMFPTFSGEWDKDKKIFTKYFEENQKIFNQDILDLDEEEVFNESDLD